LKTFTSHRRAFGTRFPIASGELRQSLNP